MSKMYFFFSSRRRHTRLTCDWSSDVCSSDLGVVLGHQVIFERDVLCRKRDHEQDDERQHVLFENSLDRDSQQDRKSTRLNSSHMSISYAVFCLKKKKKKKKKKMEKRRETEPK